MSDALAKWAARIRRHQESTGQQPVAFVVTPAEAVELAHACGVYDYHQRTGKLQVMGVEAVVERTGWSLPPLGHFHVPLPSYQPPPNKKLLLL